MLRSRAGFTLLEVMIVVAIIAANSFLLNNPDFVVTELKPSKPFDYQPFAMRTKYDFIEGYAGNDTVRGWRKYDSIYHAVFACLRGTPGYPKGEAFQVVKNGLLLRPAIPSPEVFGRSNTYGPMANFKISLRQLPDHGNFRVTVKASRYQDVLLLDAGDPVQASGDGVSLAVDEPAAARDATITVPAEGVYQLDVYRAAGDAQGMFALELDGRQTTGQLLSSKPAPNTSGEQNRPLMITEAIDFKALLLQTSWWSEDHIKILTADEATRGNILAGFRWLNQVASSDDVVLVYLSTHGNHLPLDIPPSDEADNEDEMLVTYWGFAYNSSFIDDDQINIMLNQLTSLTLSGTFGMNTLLKIIIKFTCS